MTYLLVSHTADLNGAERSLLALARGLLNQGRDFFVLCPNEGSLTEKFRAEGISYETMMLRRPRRSFHHLLFFVILWLPSVWRLRLFIKRRKVTAVYNNTIDGLYAVFAARWAGVPCIWHIREVKPNNTYGRTFFSWLLAWLPSYTVFNSIATMRAYSTQFHSRWQVIYNGIEINTPPAPSSLNKSRQSIVVGFIGQLVQHKRPDRFVRLFSLALKHKPDLYARIAGEGKLLEEIEFLVKQLDIGERVEILGFVESPNSFYKDIDILVLTSDREPFGRVLVESMAAGKPVIASDVDGIPEVVVDGVTGYLVTPDDMENFLTKIVELSDDAKLRHQMGMAGYERARYVFSLDNYQKQLIMLLDDSSALTKVS